MGTTGLQDGRMILDWLSFTLPADGGLGIVQDLFGKLDPRPRGIRGYTHSATIAGKGVVGWSPERPEQGVHVQLPSSALSNLQDVHSSFQDARGFLVFLVDVGAKIKRLDLAFDDREGQLALEKISGCVTSECLVTRWRKVDQLRAIMGGEGETLYFGSRTSESFLRIYNKRAECMDRGEEDPGHWIRVELEFKDDKAQAVVERYRQEGVTFVVGLLRGLIDFKRRAADPNKSRWPTAEWWAAFLDRADKASIALPREVPTVDRTKQWLDRQVAPALAFVTEADGGAVDFTYWLIQSGRGRMSPYQRALLQARIQGTGATA